MDHRRDRATGQTAARLRQAVGPPAGRGDRLRHRTGGGLELQRHPVGIPEHVHALPLVDAHVLHRPVERVELLLLEPGRALPRGELGLGEDLVGRLGAEARERGREELPQAAGVALAGEFAERLASHLLGGHAAAVGQRRLDHERIAAIHRRRPRRRGEELTRHHLPQAGQQPLLADRHDAVGRRRRDLRLLDRLVEGVGLTAAEPAGRRPRRKLRAVADPLRRAVRHPRERLREELREGQLGLLLEHGHQPAELDAVGMRLDLLGFGGQLVARPLQDPLRPVGALEMDPGMRVGDRRLLQVLLDAPAAALELRLHLDRHAGAVVDRLALVVGGDPLDRVLLHQLGPDLAGRDLDPLPPAVEDLGLVGLGVDPQLVVVGVIPGAGLGDDLHRLARREHAVHAGGRDADPLLAAAHPQPMKLRAVEELAEDQRDLLADDARAIVLHAHAVARAALPHLLDVDPDLGEDARLLAGVERVVHRLLDAREQRLARRIEAEQVPILGEELAHRDVALPGGERLGRRPAAGGGSGPAGRGLDGRLRLRDRFRPILPAARGFFRSLTGRFRCRFRW